MRRPPFRIRYPLRNAANSMWHTLSKTREIVRTRPMLPLDIGTTGVGLAISASSDLPLGNWLGAGLTIYGASRTAYGIYRIVAGYRFRQSGALGLRFAEPYADWDRISRLGREAIYSRVLNAALAGEAIRFPFILDESAWTPVDHDQAAVRRDLLLKPTKNDPKIRLSTDFGTSAGPAVLQLTDYMSFRVTNRLAYLEIFNEDSGLEIRFNDFDNDEIRPLSSSHSSNHIGGDLLYIGATSVILQLQKRSNEVFGCHWAGSASGSFDWGRDTVGLDDLRDVVKRGLLREFQEEAGLEDDEVPGFDCCRIIGFARAVYFGGKPQFFGVAKGPDLDPRVLPTEYVERHEVVRYERDRDGAGLLRSLDRFIAAQDRVSPSLVAVVEFLRLWIAAERSAITWLFGEGG